MVVRVKRQDGMLISLVELRPISGFKPRKLWPPKEVMPARAHALWGRG